MGTYFNPGNESFRQAVRSKIYVDKTGLINELNDVICTEYKCVAVSHARRFGKSQAAGMLRAYYSKGCDSRELFSGFEIAKAPDFEEHLNKYNVIHVDVASFADDFKENLVEKIWEAVYKEMSKDFSDIMDISCSKAAVLMDVYEKSGIPFVIIVDEWDCVVRNHSDKPELVHEYLQFLHSLFKSEESKSFLALGYITGILPIKKIEDESALNNFREYTMVNSKKLTPYFGFTEDEVKELCEEYSMYFASVKKWYDGYHINGKHMYNPNSVAQAMMDESLEPYWRGTSSYETINKLITLNFDGLKDDVLKMLEGEKVTVDVTTFNNDLTQLNSKDDALTALIHLGYLGYEEEKRKAYIPNFEVSMAYRSALKTGRWKEIAKSIERCEDLLDATIDKDEEKVAELLELAHETYTSIQKYNDEHSLSCAVTMAYFTAPAYYNIIRELPAGKGFADFAFIPRKEAGTRPAMIVELKYDKSAETAIKQIKDKRYEGALKGYEKEILLVGISHDKRTKKHECVIEEFRN